MSIRDIHDTIGLERFDKACEAAEDAFWAEMPYIVDIDLGSSFDTRPNNDDEWFEWARGMMDGYRSLRSINREAWRTFVGILRSVGGRES